MKHSEALRIANFMQDRLFPYYERCEIAGSLRRMKDDVGDIELVATPKMLPSYDLFGQEIGKHSMLDDRRIYLPYGKIIKAGQRYVQVDLWEGIKLDFFVVLPPASWGVILAIRTGPADFSKWIVTPRNKGGALPLGWKVEDGRVWDGQVTMDFQEEAKFLEWIGVGCVEPKDRQSKWNYWRRQNA